MKRRYMFDTPAKAAAVCVSLIAESCYFECEPWPDNQYLISVKDEEHPVALLIEAGGKVWR